MTWVRFPDGSVRSLVDVTVRSYSCGVKSHKKCVPRSCSKRRVWTQHVTGDLLNEVLEVLGISPGVTQ